MEHIFSLKQWDPPCPGQSIATKKEKRKFKDKEHKVGTKPLFQGDGSEERPGKTFLRGGESHHRWSVHHDNHV